MTDVYDLSLVSGDLAFGADGEPLFLTDANAIAQDVKHRLLEAGLLVDLIADDAGAVSVHRSIVAEVEEDTRIYPGTAAVKQQAAGELVIEAKTVQGVLIAQALTA
jgi:hypothetical protein